MTSAVYGGCVTTIEAILHYSRKIVLSGPPKENAKRVHDTK